MAAVTAQARSMLGLLPNPSAKETVNPAVSTTRFLNPWPAGRQLVKSPSQRTPLLKRAPTARATPRAAFGPQLPLPSLDSTAIITGLYLVMTLEDLLAAWGTQNKLILVGRLLAFSFGIVKVIAEVQKAKAEKGKAAVAKLEVQLREKETTLRERERAFLLKRQELADKEKEQFDAADPFYKVKVRNGKESGVLRFKLDEIKQVWTTGQLLSLCLNRIKEGEADDWELFVEEGAIVQKVGDEDDVVGKLLQRRYLILQRKP